MKYKEDVNIFFKQGNTDERILKSMAEDTEHEYDLEELSKALDKAKLVQKEVQVKGKNGQTFTRKQWVRTSETQVSQTQSKTQTSDNKSINYSYQELRSMKQGSVITKKLDSGDYIVYEKQDNDSSDYGSWSVHKVTTSGTVSQLSGRNTMKLKEATGWCASPKVVIDSMKDIHNTFLNVKPDIKHVDDSPKETSKNLGTVVSKKYSSKFTHVKLPESNYKSGDIVCIYNSNTDVVGIYQNQGNGYWSHYRLNSSGSVSQLSGVEDNNVLRNIKYANEGSTKNMCINPTDSMKTTILKDVHNVFLKNSPSIVTGKVDTNTKNSQKSTQSRGQGFLNYKGETIERVSRHGQTYYKIKGDRTLYSKESDAKKAIDDNDHTISIASQIPNDGVASNWKWSNNDKNFQFTTSGGEVVHGETVNARNLKNGDTVMLYNGINIAAIGTVKRTEEVILDRHSSHARKAIAITVETNDGKEYTGHSDSEYNGFEVNKLTKVEQSNESKTKKKSDKAVADEPIDEKNMKMMNKIKKETKFTSQGKIFEALEEALNSGTDNPLDYHTVESATVLSVEDYKGNGPKGARTVDRIRIKAEVTGKTSKGEKFTKEVTISTKSTTKDTTSDSSISVPKTRDEIQKLVASGKSKDDIMKLAKESGITWKEHDHSGINWMRACMAMTGTSTKGKK